MLLGCPGAENKPMQRVLIANAGVSVCLWRRRHAYLYAPYRYGEAR